ncbi:MAG TPA: type IV pilus secretin PilQ [Thermoanaerobaculia bacterium]|jgi:type IV pilus assembly protein PilQ
MRRAKRILLIASVVLVGAGSAHAGLFGSRKAQTPAPAAPALSAMSLTAVEVEGSRVFLRTTGAPAYTSYSPSPGVFVIDLTSTSRETGLAIPATLPPAVLSIAAEDVVEMGSRLTRVTFRLAESLAPEVATDGKNLTVTIPATAVPIQIAAAPAEVAPVAAIPDPQPTVSEPEVEPIVETPADVVQASGNDVVQASGNDVVTAEPIARAEDIPLPRAKSVKRIDASSNGGNVEVRIAGDGALTYKAFRLESPSRLVIDLDGVKNAVKRDSVTVDDAVVKRVRVGQFKNAPPVARVVIDLAQKSEYTIDTAGDELRVSFGSGVAAVAQKRATENVQKKAEPAYAAPAPVKIAETRNEPTPVRVKQQPKPAATMAAANDIPAQVPTIPDDPAWKMPEPARLQPASKGARPVINSAADQAPPAQQQPEDVFSEAAPVSTTSARTLAGTRTLSSGPRQFTGEPLSLNLKDADVKDVIRTFAELTGLNIAVDPDVSGSVTVDFVDVPWDQALDIILRQNGLTFTLEGNVMRIGKVERIAQETLAARRLAEEEQLNVPRTTLSFKLSYARANDVAMLLREIASTRARIIVDTRTNQLIVSEIPQYLQTMQNLITTIDVPTRQVVIEARIVESSRTFSQAYGFSWEFGGVLDPSLGTGTGLVFPNRIDFAGGPFSFTGGAAPVIGVSLTDVLGTFSLDFALHAAEAQGFTRVISAPRVTTQDNQPAEIQSGFQIPYQTRINFTTTVQYLDATLRLSVTPQITEAGTVIMDIQVQKNEPAVGLSIEGAAGTPLTTRQARTRLMVRDGGTAVIAGIFQTKDNDAQTRLPFVHQIPIIGNLFKSHNVVTSHDELLIFITPRIVRG